jgi:hypothetical protein
VEDLLGDHVRQLIGPNGPEGADPLLRTWAAYELGDEYLRRAYGLQDREIYMGVFRIVAAGRSTKTSSPLSRPTKRETD